MVRSNGHLALNMVHVIDCLEGMKRLPHEYVDLVFADSPYNIAVDYGKRKMTEITPDCPEFQHFADWFKAIAWSKYEEFFLHAATCPQCQQAFMEFKGQMELKMIQISDAELLGELRKPKPQ